MNLIKLILNHTFLRKTSIGIFMFCCMTATLYAEEVRYYDFEVIIFESLDPEARLSENWKKELSRELPQTFVELDQPYPGPIPKEYIPKYTFKTLPTDKMQLLEDAKLLEQSGNYRILLHTAWRQPGMSETTALPIHIHRSFVENTTLEQPIFRQDPDMPASGLPQPLQGAGTNQVMTTRSVLDGYIKIILSRYLHADFDLVYTTGLPLQETPAGSSANSDSPSLTTPIEPVIYRLQEIRKMRSKELHYLDHPVLGALILATPVELSDKKTHNGNR